MTDNINLIDFYNKFSTEQACRDYLEQARWDGEIICPKCGVVGESYRYKDGRLFKCGACRKQFTVRVGTIFEDSKIPLQKWFLAVYLATSLKKGVSSIQLSKYLGVTQKSSWFMLHRIRYALESGNYDKPLDGDVEMDETFVGGKTALKDKFNNKTPIVGAVQRKGRLVARVTQDTSSTTLQRLLREHVAVGANVYTDEWRGYHRTRQLGYNHRTVTHSAKQWAVGDVNTNTIESFWSHLKRGIDGIYIHVSPKHLQKYCNEFEYRYNTRGISDFERFELWFGLIGCKLTYNRLIGVQNG